jgi:DNA-binding transcriptional regulator LsrR (DeoR family)
MKKQAVPHDNDLLTEISVAYYQEDMTQEEIAQKYGISRIKVGRLLKKAREEGIVDITVRYHPIFSSRLEQELIENFNIKRALIALDIKNEVEQRRQVAALVANYLSTTLKNNQTVTVGYGRNIAAISNYTGNISQKRCHFISSVGGLNLSEQSINADHAAHNLAQKFSGTSESLYAPAYCESEAMKKAFVQNGMLKEALKRAQQADFAIVEIDSLDNDCNLVKAGLFSLQELSDMQQTHEAACEISGFGLFNSQGKPLETSLTHHTVGLTLDDLKKIPCVIGIASESTKSIAILSALKTGLIHVLATSVYNAKTILAIAK